MAKWKSKATGSVYDAYDTFNTHSSDSEYLIAIFFEGEDWKMDRPRARLKYSDLIESFEKVDDVSTPEQG
jgi:hypothetical protein